MGKAIKLSKCVDCYYYQIDIDHFETCWIDVDGEYTQFPEHIKEDTRRLCEGPYLKGHIRISGIK